MKAKHIILIVMALSILLAVIWYFCTWSLAIGEPSGGRVKYWDVVQEQYHTVVLQPEQVNQLADILRDTRPTVFICWPDRPFHEQVLITLFYADGSEKEYSLWELGNSTLYEGNAEDMTMACMLDDSIHYGGKVHAAMQDFLLQISK